MFVGRDAELEQLERHYAKNTFQMAVVYGRRRVGKTRLIAEFCKDKRALFFTALEQADTDNLADFSREIARFFDLPPSTRFASWRDALDYVADRAIDERFVLVFDEFPYAANRQPALPSTLQVAIDRRFQIPVSFCFYAEATKVPWKATSSGVIAHFTGEEPFRLSLVPSAIATQRACSPTPMSTTRSGTMRA